MKKLILIFFVLPFCLKAQIIVGDTVSANIVYKNIKDSIIGSMSGNSTAQADFDLDSDNIMDVRFKIIRSISPGHTAIEQQVFSLNNLEFVLDTSQAGYADTVFLNSQINAGLNWGNSTSGSYLYTYFYSGGNYSIAGAFKYPDNYLGFRKISAVDTVYGWILVDGSYFSHNRINIRSWAYQSKLLGIYESDKQDEILIYPNPANNILHVSNENNTFENSTIEVTNYLGQTVIKQACSNNVDVSKLPVGIYTLKILTSGKENLYSKFIKE